jgi:hypothetical protein
MDSSTRAITPLRQRMIDDMRMRKLSDKTQHHYIRAVRQFAGFLGRSPDTASVEDLRRYQLHLVDRGTSPVSLNAAITGLKFFFEVTLDHGELMYAKRPFAGPAAVLAYLSRYTHRVAISNRRLVALDERGVTFRWKDYRAKGRTRYKTMTLSAPEFMRRFLLHVLPSGFHRIRHYGLVANAGRTENLARARELLHVVPAATEPQSPAAPADNLQPTFVCPHCHAAMIIIQTFARGESIRAPPALRAAA